MVLLGCVLSIKKKELKKHRQDNTWNNYWSIISFFSDLVKTLGHTGNIMFSLQYGHHL